MSRLRVNKRRTVCANIFPEEYDAIHAIAARNNVTLSEYLRAIIIDVIDEEGHATQRRGQTGHSEAGERLAYRGGSAA